MTTLAEALQEFIQRADMPSSDRLVIILGEHDDVGLSAGSPGKGKAHTVWITHEMLLDDTADPAHWLLAVIKNTWPTQGETDDA